MRRMLAFALAAAATTATALGLGAAPAWAHNCAVPALIPVGRSAPIKVAVTVEKAAVTDIEVGLPAGLRLDRVDRQPGWTATRSGSTVRYRGGPTGPYTCAFFSLGVTAAAKGAFGISVVQRTADGTVVARSTPDPESIQDQFLSQFVYAGVDPPKRPDSSSGPSVTTIAGIALLGFGLVMFAVLVIRTRRTRKLEARVEEFKKRTPDPPPPESDPRPPE